jgi:hypothetical protein
VPEEVGDGVVRLYSVDIQLRLSGTKLVVLSCCLSGLIDGEQEGGGG